MKKEDLLTADERAAAKAVIVQYEAADLNGAGVDAGAMYGPSILSHLVKAVKTIDILVEVLDKQIQATSSGRDGCTCITCVSRELYDDLS